MKTYATLFTGGDGFGLGARAAGLKSTWGVEIDPEIVEWAERNDPDLSVVRADVSVVDYGSLEVPYLLHASPQCTRASRATQAGESEQDIAQAGGIISALQALRPPVFTLENVWFYRKFQAFKNILYSLAALGYKADFWHLSAADYGVPQTRKRLILIARRDSYPRKPLPTHTKSVDCDNQLSLFDHQLRPWIGWYEAINDLIPTLPDSEFPKWQLERLERWLIRRRGATVTARDDYGLDAIKREMGWIIGQGGYNGEIVTRQNTLPSFTITANHNQNGIKAFLVDGQSSGMRENITIRKDNLPSFTVACGDAPRAFLIPGDNASNEVVRRGDEPMVTIRARSIGQNPARAFVVGCQNNGPANRERGLTIRKEREPVFTIVSSSHSMLIRAQLATGRVVKLTSRALARLQGVPDWYDLPENDRLACKINGNMVPPLLAQRICESQRHDPKVYRHPQFN